MGMLNLGLPCLRGHGLIESQFGNPVMSVEWHHRLKTLNTQVTFLTLHYTFPSLVPQLCDSLVLNI